MTRPALNRKLALEGATPVPDGAGGILLEWNALGTVWAEVQSRRASEESAGGATGVRLRHTAILRASPPGSPSRPRADQRFREGERVFEILGIGEYDREGRYLGCWLEEAA